ncbi:MAG: DNA polymerase III subunit delta [Lachnospiraceae bacterium]|nr:DNA polymerase III subunit delta [Lachnospiraceae bacterium]
MERSDTSAYPAQRKQIEADIATASFRPCYLLYGEESYLVRRYKLHLTKALLDGADRMNLHTVKGEEADPSEMIRFAETMPFFAKRRVIVAEETGFFKNGCAELEEYFREMPASAVFVFAEKEVTANRALTKRATAIGRLLHCERLSAAALKTWVVSVLGKQEGKLFKESVIDRFLEHTGNDMFLIEQEMEKLISYCADKKEITAKDIDAVCRPHLISKVFDLTDALAQRDRAAAMRHYVTLTEMEESPNKLIALIERQFFLMLEVREMQLRHTSDAQIASAVGIAPWLVAKYRRWAQHFTENECRNTLELCLSNERALKRSMMDKQIALEMIIAGCTAKTGGN